MVSIEPHAHILHDAPESRTLNLLLHPLVLRWSFQRQRPGRREQEPQTGRMPSHLRFRSRHSSHAWTVRRLFRPVRSGSSSSSGGDGDTISSRVMVVSVCHAFGGWVVWQKSEAENPQVHGEGLRAAPTYTLHRPLSITRLLSSTSNYSVRTSLHVPGIAPAGFSSSPIASLLFSSPLSAPLPHVPSFFSISESQYLRFARHLGMAKALVSWAWID